MSKVCQEKKNEEQYPGKSIPLAVTSLLSNTPFFALEKVSATLLRLDCESLEWIS